MPTSEIRSFTDPSEFAAAIHGVDVDLTFVGSGPFSAKITRIDLGSISIQRLSESLPLIIHASNLGEHATFGFHTQPGQSLVRDGVEVTWDKIVHAGRSQSQFQRSAGPMDWGSISLQMEDVTFAEISALGINLPAASSEKIITPRPEALAKLRRVHAAIGSISRDAPELIADSEAARGLEQTLMQALIGCLDDGQIQEQTPSQQRHHAIMQRFHAVLDAESDRPVYVLEMATAVGASIRTLSVCCHEHLGLGPKRYLLLRRMYLARQALREADPAETSVTAVATQYGFWQFGRFAGQYKSLFGELPSVTLRKAAAGRHPDASHPIAAA
jgi:AraC-like DNA-binding protein